MITPKLTINFHKYMARKYNFKIVNKDRRCPDYESKFPGECDE